MVLVGLVLVLVLVLVLACPVLVNITAARYALVPQSMQQRLRQSYVEHTLSQGRDGDRSHSTVIA